MYLWYSADDDSLRGVVVVDLEPSFIYQRLNRHTESAESMILALTTGKPKGLGPMTSTVPIARSAPLAGSPRVRRCPRFPTVDRGYLDPLKLYFVHVVT